MMYSTTKKPLCPKCGKRDLSENAYCAYCLAPLLENNMQELWGRWAFDKFR